MVLPRDLVGDQNYRVCWMSMSPGPSRTIPDPLPFILEVPYIDGDHYMGVSSTTGKLSSATKSARNYDLILSI